MGDERKIRSMIDDTQNKSTQLAHHHRRILGLPKTPPGENFMLLE